MPLVCSDKQCMKEMEKIILYTSVMIVILVEWYKFVGETYTSYDTVIRVSEWHGTNLSNWKTNQWMEYYMILY